MADDPRIDDLLTRFRESDRIALARLITLVENRAPEAVSVMEQLYPLTGKAHVIGITGPPGAGKSTLINLMIGKLRARQQKVAVLAIDPSSPFSGGAVLGDRVRMTDHYRDPGVYIRSISTRGSHGGLSRAAREVVRVLDAFGHDTIIIETVGVGQTELDVMDLAETVVVVLVPESGDSVQVMKAGLNEIADIFVVNKSDRGGADRMKAELELSVHLRADPGWRVPVMMTQANADHGIDELLAEIVKHREYLRAHQDPDRVGERRAHEFIEVLAAAIEERAVRGLSNGAAPELLNAVRAGELNPYSAARRIIEDRQVLARLLSGRHGESQ
jgi:GTPase